VSVDRAWLRRPPSHTCGGFLTSWRSHPNNPIRGGGHETAQRVRKWGEIFTRPHCQAVTGTHDIQIPIFVLGKNVCDYHNASENSHEKERAMGSGYIKRSVPSLLWIPTPILWRARVRRGAERDSESESSSQLHAVLEKLGSTCHTSLATYLGVKSWALGYGCSLLSKYRGVRLLVFMIEWS